MKAQLAQLSTAARDVPGGDAGNARRRRQSNRGVHTMLSLEKNLKTMKETKPENELMQILMSEIHKYPECHECNYVIGVAIRQNRRASYDCNWYPEWIVIDGSQLECPHALEITKQLQAQFDLA
jgi:hypothetical protein